MLDGIAGRIVLLEGWRRWLLALAAGAFGSLALPPLGVMPALAIALPILVWLIDGVEGLGPWARLRSAFAVGWAFGLGYLTASLYWIAEAFLVEADTFGWMAPFAVPLLAGGLALFHGVGAVLARLAWSDGPWRIAALALGLGLSEWARGHVATGFPWNVPGLALAAYDAPAQGASLVGVHGLSILALLVFASPAAIAFAADRKAAFAAPALALLALATLWGWGAWRLGSDTGAVVGLSGLRGVADDARGETWVRIVQPSIPQDEKWRSGSGEAVLEAYLALSRAGPSDVATPRPLDAIDAVVWPESAFPFVLAETPEALSRIADLAEQGPAVLTGALRLDRSATGADGRFVAYNSLYAIDAGGIAGAYDKTHLVPFGEYLPWQSVLERVGLSQLARMRGGFTAGTLRHAMSVPGLPPFQPLVCYEAIFPGELFGDDVGRAGDAADRPAWLLNVTNDAWFGASVGPAQHLAHARLRAIEEGLPMVRAANTGISALIDAQGRIRARLDLGRRDAMDVALPAAVDPPPFAHWRWRAVAGLLLLCGAIAAAGRWRKD